MIAQRTRVSWYAMVACMAATAGGAVVQNVALARYELRIAAQPLADALKEFSRQSGIQVIFFARLSDGIESRGAIGTFTLDEALLTLLADSGLSFRVVNARTVQIFRPAPPAPRTIGPRPSLALGCCHE